LTVAPEDIANNEVDAKYRYAALLEAAENWYPRTLFFDAVLNTLNDVDTAIAAAKEAQDRKTPPKQKTQPPPPPQQITQPPAWRGGGVLNDFLTFMRGLLIKHVPVNSRPQPAVNPPAVKAQPAVNPPAVNLRLAIKSGASLADAMTAPIVMTNSDAATTLTALTLLSSGVHVKFEDRNLLPPAFYFFRTWSVRYTLKIDDQPAFECEENDPHEKTILNFMGRGFILTYEHNQITYTYNCQCALIETLFKDFTPLNKIIRVTTPSMTLTKGRDVAVVMPP
jgi:hypothetical protein